MSKEKFDFTEDERLRWEQATCTIFDYFWVVIKDKVRKVRGWVKGYEQD